MSYGNSYSNLDSSPCNAQVPTAEIRMGSSQYQDYDRVSQISEPRRPPSPGPSRSYPSYDRYVPGHDEVSHGGEYLDKYKSTSWRHSTRHRGFSGDHYEPPDAEEWPRSNNTRSPPYKQGQQDPKDSHDSGSWDRRDTMAARMFEPSAAWKQTHVPGSSRDERYLDRRGRTSREISPDGRSRDIHPYPSHGDSYRHHPSTRNNLENVHYSRPADCYRPDYDEGDPRGSPYAADGRSGTGNKRRRPARSPHRPRAAFGGSHYEPDDRSYSGSPSSSRASSPTSPRRFRRDSRDGSLSPRSSRSGGRAGRVSRRARSRSGSISSADSRSYPPAKPRSNLPVRRDASGPHYGGITTAPLSVNTSVSTRLHSDFPSPASTSHPPMHPSLPARPIPSGSSTVRDRTYTKAEQPGPASPPIPRSYVGAYTRGQLLYIWMLLTLLMF
ncbi:hypothetical protein OF83DRAFT_1115542 [Amylostereum chailletii]|nr:hypothetical protein OF83DRAFT_1115542 [Amylostereum chailletii]